MSLCMRRVDAHGAGFPRCVGGGGWAGRTVLYTLDSVVLRVSCAACARRRPCLANPPSCSGLVRMTQGAPPRLYLSGLWAVLVTGCGHRESWAGGFLGGMGGTFVFMIVPISLLVGCLMGWSPGPGCRNGEDRGLLSVGALLDLVPPLAARDGPPGPGLGMWLYLSHVRPCSGLGCSWAVSRMDVHSCGLSLAVVTMFWSGKFRM